MADTPTPSTTDPAQQFIVGGAPQPEPQPFEFLGQKFPSPEAAQAYVAEYIRSKETEVAELRGAASSRQTPVIPQTPAQQAQFDQEQYFKAFANNPREANKQWLAYELFGDANAKVDPIQVLRESAMTTLQLRQQVQALTLKNEHPEINWSDQKQVQLIEETARQHGYEGAIAILQREGKLPNRHQYEQWKAEQMRSMFGAPAPQAAQPGQQASMWSTQGATNVVPMPVQPPPSVPRGGGAPQPTYDVQAMLARMNEISSKSNSERTKAEDQEFDRLWEIYSRSTAQTRVG